MERREGLFLLKIRAFPSHIGAAFFDFGKKYKQNKW